MTFSHMPLLFANASIALQEKNVGSSPLDGRVGRMFMPQQQLEALPTALFKVLPSGFCLTSLHGLEQLPCDRLCLYSVDQQRQISQQNRKSLAVQDGQCLLKLMNSVSHSSLAVTTLFMLTGKEAGEER